VFFELPVERSSTRFVSIESERGEVVVGKNNLVISGSLKDPTHIFANTPRHGTDAEVNRWFSELGCDGRI
jgi:hypothetical protein